MRQDAVHDAVQAAATVIDIIENIAGIREQYSGAADAAMRASCEYLAGTLKEMGLEVKSDGGNISAVLPGKDAALPAVAMVARLSLGPAAGKYGGTLAAAGAAAIAAGFAKSGERLAHSVKVIILAEGACEIPAGEIKAFLEFSAEHGGYLAREGAALGIVGAIASPTKLKITVTADIAARLDKTPLNERQDVLVSAAMLVLAVRNIAAQEAENGIVATVESLSAVPAGAGLIPDRAEMMVDIRGVRHDSVIDFLQEIKDEASAVSEEQNVTVAIAVLSSGRPARLDGGIANLVEESCRQYKISHEHIDSLAEYAALEMAGVAGGALAVIPCRRAADDPAAEVVDKKDIENGIKVLSEVLRRLAG